MKYRNKKGQLHREDGPAIELANGDKEYWVNGQLHREDGPAIELASGTKSYYVNGKRHREDGPAIEDADGYKAYWVNGQYMSEQDFKNRQESKNKIRKYLPTLSELIDRLSIIQLKEVKIPEHKNIYAQEIKDIIHDIQLILNESPNIDAKTIRAIVVLSQMNSHIWENETNYRNNKNGNYNLELTHGLNGIRNTAKNKIQEVVGGRKDYKIDCLAADFKDWEISW